MYFALTVEWSSAPSGKNIKPMIWRDLTNQVNDCYFCLSKTFGVKNSIKYADVPSVTGSSFRKCISFHTTWQKRSN